MLIEDFEIFQREVMDRAEKAFEAASMGLVLEGRDMKTVNARNLTLMALSVAAAFVGTESGMTAEGLVESFRLAIQVAVHARSGSPERPEGSAT
jgi:hypothetical protein